MEGKKRREEILRILLDSDEAISGSNLANMLEVSRQVIVSDIALLRATDKNILSTNKGYVLFQKQKISNAKRVYKVKHSNEEMLDELYTIVDAGGELVNVVVEHPIYGQILVDLIIKNRKDADAFVTDIKKYNTKPLTTLTDGIHFHTVEASGEQILDMIENELMRKGYLFV